MSFTVEGLIEDIERHRKELLEEVAALDAVLEALGKPEPAPKANGARKSERPGVLIRQYLRENPGSMPSAIAEALGMDRTNVSVTLGRLRKHGLAWRTTMGWAAE